MNTNSYPRELRLLTPLNFKNVFSNPKRAGSAHLTLLAKNANLTHTRLGLAVPKKHVNKAHDRNRIKRIIREDFRLKQHQLPHVDIVIVAKGGIKNLSNQELRDLLGKLWQKISRQYKN